MYFIAIVFFKSEAYQSHPHALTVQRTILSQTEMWMKICGECVGILIYYLVKILDMYNSNYLIFSRFSFLPSIIIS